MHRPLMAWQAPPRGARRRESSGSKTVSSVPGEQLAQAWGLTRQALAPAADRGEVFAVKVGNRLYYPQAFLGMDRETVAAICRAHR